MNNNININSKQNKFSQSEKTVLWILLFFVIISSLISICIANNKNIDTEPNDRSASVSSELNAESMSPTETFISKQISISVGCNEGGEVEGSDTVSKGSDCTIIARPDDGYEFAGWYVDDKIVSRETLYKFKATQDTSFYAKFEKIKGFTLEKVPS